MRAHSEHHQREDLFGSLVLVRRSFSSFYNLDILPSKVRFPCSGFSSFHRLQNHHPVLHRREVQPPLQDGRRTQYDWRLTASIEVRRKYDDDIRKCLQYVLNKSYLGDWFVLYQLAKNCNPYFYREFIRWVCADNYLHGLRSANCGDWENHIFVGLGRDKITSWLAVLRKPSNVIVEKTYRVFQTNFIGPHGKDSRIKSGKYFPKPIQTISTLTASLSKYILCHDFEVFFEQL